MPEVAGNAAIYFDPKNEVSIKNEMIRILTDEKLRDQLVAAGEIRSKDFSWEKTAAETKLVYESIL